MILISLLECGLFLVILLEFLKKELSMESTRVLYISQEITPYLPETEMSVIARNLPQGIQERGREIRTFMPKFGCINERRNQLHEVIRLSGMNLIINDSDHPLIIKVASIQSARMQVYFIDNEDYFQRKSIFGNESVEFFPDNDERCIFFCRGVLETVKKLRWSPDIIHCHGWFTSLIPIFIKKAYNDDPMFGNSKIVVSLYNNGFDQIFDAKFHEKIIFEGIEQSDVNLLKKEPTYNNLLKLAVNFSDGIIKGSENLNSDIEKYIEKSKIPVLNHPSEENYIDAYSKFYDKILNPE
jgi:starch synthase